jgi:hypothetical protein
MATPTDPTVSTICIEGLKKAGLLAYTAADLTRATDQWFQEVLNDIWDRSVSTGNTRLKSLQNTAYYNSVVGKRTIDLAEDFDEETKIVLLDGTVRGTASAGGATSITLANTETIPAARAIGKNVFITGGIGPGQMRQIVNYSISTFIATVDTAWTINPTSSSTYLIVEQTWPLEEDNSLDLDDLMPQAYGRPTRFAKYNGQLIFDRAFNLSTYGIMLRYYMNIHQVDLTEGSTTRITRILRNWQATLKQGIFYKALETNNDNQYGAAKQEYERLIGGLVNKETAYGGEFVGFTL